MELIKYSAVHVHPFQGSVLKDQPKIEAELLQTLGFII